MSDLTESERKLIELLRECRISDVDANFMDARIKFEPARHVLEEGMICGHHIAEAFYAAMERRG